MAERGRLHICRPNYRGVIEGCHEMSMLNLLYELGKRDIPVQMNSPTGTILSQARMGCTHAAISDPECTHTLWVDDDMAFVPEQYFELEKILEERELDYLSALCFANVIPTKPCIFGKVPGVAEGDPEKPWWMIASDWPKGKVVEVAATGFGMVLIRTSMLRAMAKTLSTGGDLFRSSHPMCPNEDVAFCLNARAQGFRLWAHTGVSISHISKERPLINEEVYEAQQNAAEYYMGLSPHRLGDCGLELEPVNAES